ncbi:FtsH-binding integral membrane protein [Actinoplanes tereljensis]|uniref:Uncharacterized protein n=1 Tax=Paractinoplanes tereljensis TaxID=571912 RepID=A0A919NVJ1_9ACTN|nr:hypothetical protein [Actinoplanes tereljensis]GIF26049.1 hypothetical protein Ate02nite_87790 [Actinoplanes tereljensis]
MVSRPRAMTIAVAWLVAGLLAGVLGLAAATGNTDFRGTLLSSLPSITVFLLGSLIVAGLWVALGARNARSSASLGGQAALFGLAGVLVAVLLLAVLEQALGRSAF